MAQKYNPQRKQAWSMYIPGDPKPFKLSRSKIASYVKCPRCFYLDRRLGVGHPPGFPFSLNLAVDALLKKEFDIYRKEKKPHPLMALISDKIIPAQHPQLEDWRNNRKGVQSLHKETNFLVTGAIDGLWVEGDLYTIPDYKATSRQDPVLEVPVEYGYHQQLEVYQWLLRRNGLKVSNTVYFVYANGIKDAKRFDQQLLFAMTLIPAIGNDSWVEQTLLDIHKCLNSPMLPKAGDDCDYCKYRDAVQRHMPVKRGVGANG